jgi:NDP-sugar pyrophosphorylase family protein
MLADAMVLAAGKSTRIAAVGGGTPKPLLLVQGEPILVRNVRWLGAAGVRRIWVNLHYRGDLIRAALGDGSAWGVEIHYSEEPGILGTAGGVRKVLSSLGETFLVVYGDNLVELDIDAFVESHRSRRADVSIALFDDSIPNTGMAGGRVALGAEDNVVSFTEGDSGVEPAGFVNAGVYAVEHRVLSEFPEGRFLDWGKDVFPALLAGGARILRYPIEGYCLGLDTPASYERGMALISSGQVRLQ